jgi:polysaccharide biosynthesis protein PslH
MKKRGQADFMHILFVTPVVPSPSYGKRPFNFIRILAREHKIYLASFLTHEPADLAALRQLAEWGVVARVVRHPKWRGISNCALNLWRLDPLRSMWIRSGPLAGVVDQFLSHYPIDIAHFDRMRMGHFALPLEKTARLVDFTDALTLYIGRSSTQYRSPSGRLIDAWEKWRIPSYERKILRNVEGALCCSEIDRKVFKENHPDFDVDVIYNSVDTRQFKPRRREKDPSPRLVFTGTFSYFANLDSLFFFMDDIWPALRREYPGIQLDVIGARPPEQVLALDKKEGVRVLADVPDMADHLFENDFFICPLRVASGMRNKVMEAMASGMTVISSRIGVEGLKIEPDRHYLEAETREDFIHQIGRALQCKTLRESLGQQSRAYVENFHDPQQAAGTLLQIYEKVIRKHSGHRNGR